MKKIIQFLLIILLVLIIFLAIIFIFNPFNLRTKIIGGVINSYLTSETKEDEATSDDSSTLDNGNEEMGAVVEQESSVDSHPLLNEEQEKTLEKYGVDVEKLPSNISPAMEACFIDKLGEERANEIVNGSSPSAMEIFNTRNCLNK